MDAYAELGVGLTATAAELKAAHRRLVRQHHPDLAPPQQRPEATRRVQRINVAYGLVRDETSRLAYDRLRAQRAGAAAAARAAHHRAASDARLAAQWEAMVTDAGRWAGQWWASHGPGVRRSAQRVRRRTARAGLDVVGRVLWLASSAGWAAVMLLTGIAAQQMLGMDGQLTYLGALIGGWHAGSERGWRRRLRLAGLPPPAAPQWMSLAVGAGVLASGMLLDAALARVA